MNNMKYDWLRAIDCGIYGWLMLLLVQFIPLRRQVLLLPAAGSGVSWIMQVAEEESDAAAAGNSYTDSIIATATAIATATIWLSYSAILYIVNSC